MKKLAVIIGVGALLAGARAEIVVTSTGNEVDSTDGVITLREAIEMAHTDQTETDDDGYKHIGFSYSLFENTDTITITLTGYRLSVTNGLRLAIAGPENSRKVRIFTSSLEDNVYIGADSELRMESINLTSGNRGYGYYVNFAVGGEFLARNCQIDGNGRSQFCFDCKGGGKMGFERCTFVNSHGNDSLLKVRQGGSAHQLCCTFDGSHPWYENVFRFLSGSTNVMVGCTVGSVNTWANDSKKLFGVDANAEVIVASTVFSSENPFSSEGGGGVTLLHCRTAALPSAVAVPYRGVTHSVRKLTDDLNDGRYVGHSTDWTKIFLSETKAGADREYLLGANAISIVMETRDIVGREIVQGHVSPGSYATMTKLEKMDPAAIVVNVRTDSQEASADDAYSTRFELREVIDYLRENPSCRAANGVANISFDPNAFTGQMSERLRMQAAQIEIDGFTKGKLVIDGGSDSHVMFDGAAAAGGSVSNRLFYVAPGNNVEFRNLEFANGVANTSGKLVGSNGGGAIYNRGTVFVTNCSFRACSAGTDAAGNADGGAILTAAGGKTVLYGVTIENCTAARGGAIATREGGTNVIAATTICGNRAVRGANFWTVAGGAVYAEGDESRTVIVQSTVTGNESEGSGGGVIASGSGAKTTLYILDSAIVGNRANGEVDDLVLGNRATARYSVLGRRTPAMDSRFDTEATNVKEGKSPVDVFAFIGDGGAAEPYSTLEPILKVEHSVFPRANDREYDAAIPLADAAWENFGYKVGSAKKLLCGTLRVVKATATELPCDQIGDTLTAEIGATTASFDPDIPYSENPLLVTSATVEALRTAVDSAAANPMLADANGIFNIEFQSGVGAIAFGNAEPISPAVPVRIVGPLTVSGATKGVFLLAEGAELQLENVTFANCSREDYGGAIAGENASVVAEGCAFSGCRATDPGYGSVGGAVGMIGEYGQMEYVRCSFDSCSADLGTAIYHEDTDLWLVDCRFDGASVPGDNVVCEPPRVRVDRADQAVTNQYFDTAAAAIENCQYGDTLAIISEDVPDLDEVASSLPAGVAFTNETGTALTTVKGAALMPLVSARVAANVATTDWLKAVETESGIGYELDETNAVPRIEGENAFEVSETDGTVSVSPSNVKPYLFYGLGRSATPGGEFTVGEWVRADESGRLPESLSAPTSGHASFYRIMVKQQ